MLKLAGVLFISLFFGLNVAAQDTQTAIDYYNSGKALQKEKKYGPFSVKKTTADERGIRDL